MLCIAGWLKHREGSYATGVTVLATVTMAAAVLVFLFPMHPVQAAPRRTASGSALLPRASSGSSLEGKNKKKQGVED